MKLVFNVSQSQRLIFTSAAVEQLENQIQKNHWQPEAGGVLLGRHLSDSGNIVIDEVTIPQPSDRRTRFSFFRSEAHERLARKRWLEEANTLAYLGLWHTHPEDSPTPSFVDRNDWHQAIANDTFYGERLFFPIIGRKEIRVWTKSRSSPIRELKRVSK